MPSSTQVLLSVYVGMYVQLSFFPHPAGSMLHLQEDRPFHATRILIPFSDPMPV